MSLELKGKKILVTGANGFIGSHLVERLTGHGVNVRAFVRYNSRNDWGALEMLPKEILRNVEVLTGDLRDTHAIYDAIKDTSVIFHLGALIAIPYSYIHPAEVIETNIMGTLNVLMAARERNIEKIIHVSTSEVYGSACYVPIDENHPLQGQSPYSASKIGADKIAESFYRSYNLPIVTVRPFNTYGPRQSARAVIPTIITQALEQKEIKLGSLHTTRDFTFVEDTVSGFIKASESDEAIGQTINLGSNFEISVGDIANKIISILGVKSQILVDETRIRPQNSEVERLWCDNSKAKRVLQWDTQIPFEEGIRRTINWFSENKGRYKTELYNI
jgi:NAD dependent epimerase/dehydratase